MTLYKYIHLVILTICITISSHSQSFISSKIGPSFPLGDYIKDELPNEDGYAITGFTFQAEGAYLPHKLIGLGLHYSYGSNSFTTEKYINNDRESFEKGKYVIHNLMGLFVCLVIFKS